MQKNIFQTKKDLTLSSGQKSNFKIECDNIDDEDLDTIARLVSKKVNFNRVYCVPTGGRRFAEFLAKYSSNNHHDPCLLVDDVLTTGNSMIQAKGYIKSNVLGIVLFSRGTCPNWIIPIFQMNELFYNITKPCEVGDNRNREERLP